MARRAQTLFVLPSAQEPPSGGNLYNEGLLAALTALGAPYARSSLGELDAVRGAFDEVWIDSVYLAHWAALRARFGGACGFALLLHALPSSLMRAEGRAAGAWLALEARALAAFDRALVTSATSAELVAAAAPALRCCIVPPAIQRAEQGSRSAHGSVRALIVANVTRNKGLLSFLRALAARVREADDFTLRCIGRLDVDLSYAQACAECVRTHPALAARVTLAGVQPPSEVSRALSHAEISISASRFESFGMAIADARASGCVVLAHAGGHVAQLVDGASGGALHADDAGLADAFLTCVRDRGQLARRLALADQQRLAPRSYLEVAREFLRYARAGGEAAAPRNAQ
jgi:glycosyltransferase involved in cell wall biosynthesis